MGRSFSCWNAKDAFFKPQNLRECGEDCWKQENKNSIEVEERFTVPLKIRKGYSKELGREDEDAGG